MPAEGAAHLPPGDVLSADEIGTIVRVAARLGVCKVRITGGEPLLRPDILDVVECVAGTPGIVDVSMTTNGSMLADLAVPLRMAGLQRINISLDSLDANVWSLLSRSKRPGEVLAGLDAAMVADLSPVKLNAVVIRGLNDEHVCDLARLTLSRPVHVRFIELMPVGWMPAGLPAPWLQASADSRAARSMLYSFPMSTGNYGSPAYVAGPAGCAVSCDSIGLRGRFVPASETFRRIEAGCGPLEPADVMTNGPARTWRLPGSAGTVGLISQISDDACAQCNRLRLTADGMLRPCLMADGEVDIRHALRSGECESEIERYMLRAIADKPREHRLNDGCEPQARGMSQVGG
jgi:cyclic pyranopterin phosphate synthase